MTPEIEKAIRDKVDAFKASGKKLARGLYTTCIIGALGGHKEAEDLMGDIPNRALEAGFEGWGSRDPHVLSSAHEHPDFYELGQKIAKENGL